MSKHTPGPWYADMVAFNGHSGVTINAKGSPRIATVYWREVDQLRIDGGEMLHEQEANAITVANAKLIAEAPAMYEALHEVIALNPARPIWETVLEIRAILERIDA